MKKNFFPCNFMCFYSIFKGLLSKMAHFQEKWISFSNKTHQITWEKKKVFFSHLLIGTSIGIFTRINSLIVLKCMFHKSIGNLGVLHIHLLDVCRCMCLQNNPLLVPVFVVKRNRDHQMPVQRQLLREMLVHKFYEHDKQIVHHFPNYFLIRDPTIWK